MTKQCVYYLTEIRPEDCTEDVDGASAPLNAKRFRVSSACEAEDADTADVWRQIRALRSKQHQQVAIAGLLYLVKVAQSGQPLTASFDKKALHETHAFTSPVSRQTEKIWRYRRGDVRILFYYAADRVVLLSGVLIKLKDKLSKAEELAAERAVNLYLDAQTHGRLTWV
jgi:mRNA-degrading endonuclease RelE of RelBE toxin-antitoxin system